MNSLFGDKELLYYTPRLEALCKVSFPVDEPEMSEFESAFLCGLIREMKPKKIMEIGVAAGGTTAIILECLSQLDLNKSAELYSIDCSELYYRGTGEKSGYLAEEYKRVSGWEGRHSVFLGKYFPEVVAEIGNEIDFVVLDTAHCLPGELLDFLAVFSFLKPHACVVLHDIILNHIENPVAIATQLLFDVVVADKCLTEDASREHGCSNIGAFVINDDSAKYIANVFHALSVSWYYLPDRNIYEQYLKLFEKYYSPDLLRYARTIYELQFNTCEKFRHELYGWKSSKSYKIGKMVTRFPRWIKDLFVK